MRKIRILEAADDGFLLNGEPFQLIAGAMHYFRIHPDQWADRIDKARLMGLNTIDVYVPWNAHQPRSGEVVLDGILDLPRYLQLIDDAGLHVVLRPGPYICAEWDGGGLPGWLSTSGVRLRSSDPAYLEAVDAWFDQLLPVVAPFLGASGGPILAVQVENEFGAYGPEDPAYLRHLADGLRRRGVTELLFTCDQAEDDMLRRGGLDGILRTVTFEHVDGALEKLRQHQPTGPLMCAEFWVGWFDHWGGPHHTRDAADAAKDLDTILAAGASVSLYMFHGGTNFGTTNGADFKHVYLPTITSYDYDAPLSEAGDVTEKYLQMRDVIARYAPVPDEALPARPARLERAGIPLDETIGLLAAAPTLGAAVTSLTPLTLEQLGESNGFVLYETALPAAGPAVLAIEAFADRIQVFVDGAPAGTLERNRLEHALTISPARPGAVLSVLVENGGRVNYGIHMNDPKGILGPVLVDGKPLTGWTQIALPLRDLTGLAFAPADDRPPAGPVFRRGSFTIDTPTDTFLSLPGWEQGAAWINGFALGRYSARGPQRTLFVPGPVLRAGRNEIVLLELKAATGCTVDLVSTPDLG